jgi:flagellar motility protein MotE (MotC chaperone)
MDEERIDEIIDYVEDLVGVLDTLNRELPKIQELDNSFVERANDALQRIQEESESSHKKIEDFSNRSLETIEKEAKQKLKSLGELLEKAEQAEARLDSLLERTNNFFERLSSAEERTSILLQSLKNIESNPAAESQLESLADTISAEPESGTLQYFYEKYGSTADTPLIVKRPRYHHDYCLVIRGEDADNSNNYKLTTFRRGEFCQDVVLPKSERGYILYDGPNRQRITNYIIENQVIDI